MLKKRIVTLFAIAVLLSLSVGIAIAASNIDTKKITLADGTSTDCHFSVTAKAGISWWDTCKAEFYFVKENIDFVGCSQSEKDAILTTFPNCKTYKTNGNSLLNNTRFTYGYRKYSYSTSTAWMAYGTLLEVEINTNQGNKTYSISCYY